MKSSKGFTLTEIIMVILILAILAAVAIPKFMDLSYEANLAVCKANRGAIESACMIAYVKQALDGYDPSYPWWEDSTLYPGGIVPYCPTGGNYSYDSDSGKITSCDQH